MLPAQQGLDTRHPPPTHVQHRLAVELELAALERPGEPVRELGLPAVDV